MMSTINVNDNSRQNITFISIFAITLYELKQANFVNFVLIIQNKWIRKL